MQKIDKKNIALQNRKRTIIYQSRTRTRVNLITGVNYTGTG
jgi:hypothetical protein